MRIRSPRFAPAAAAIALLLLPLILFWAQTVGGRTLLPAENLYQHPPYQTARAALSVPAPYNLLLDDLVLQNMQWKAFIRAELAAGEIPLWNPHQFSGIPFLAAGQQSTLYPFSVIYYGLPLAAAYGWFTVSQLWLAGLCLYAFARGLSISRAGALLAGVTYQLAGFFVVSAVFPMIIAAAAWLPLILLMCENILRDRPLRGRPARVVWLAIGAVALGCNVLAGHVEITYYALLTAGAYSAVRLAALAITTRRVRPLIAPSAALLGMVSAGLALGAVQFWPLFNFVGLNFRTGSATMDDIRQWAHPARDLLLFILPNFYGSPVHTSYFDVFTQQTITALVNTVGQPVARIEWGIKNYVEGAVYFGLAPLLLAALGALRGSPEQRVQRLTLAAIGLLALTFMFGLPTYALLLNTLPGFNQVHSPFRWIVIVTLCAAVLAGFGFDALTTHRRAARRVGIAALTIGGGGLALVVLAWAAFPVIEPLLTAAIAGMRRAPDTFADARMLFSYLLPQFVILGVVLSAIGAVLVLRRRIPPAALIVVTALDLLIAWWGFHPASDPALLDYTPPAIAWLQEQPGEWRYIPYVDPYQGDPKVFNANLTLRYGLDDVTGYESIIPRQYVDYMGRIAPQVQIDFNRIAPIYSVYPPVVPFDPVTALTSPYLDLLNVRYVIALPQVDLSGVPGFVSAYTDDAVRIWENPDYAPRAFTVPSAAVPGADADPLLPRTPAALTTLSSRERSIAVSGETAHSLILSETYLPGWRGFIRPAASTPDAEQPLALELAYGNFIGAAIPPGDWIVRLIYSPAEFQLGAFTSLLGGIALALTLGVWGWRTILGAAPAEGSTGRVARNAIAPILLNLFNRGIDFGFAFVMLRVLGPEGAGAYFYAGVIFMWFDILTNFGLNLYLTREAARDRNRAAALFMQTTALRLLLLIVGVPVLIGFIAVRQATVTPPLDSATLTALGLLYVGLIPGTISTGLTALYYAFERAEQPALIATVATLCKALLGLIALLAGAGIVGLAGVSIFTNLVTLGLLLAGARMLLAGWRGQRADGGTLRRMTGQSWPLMLNHLLATIFFQIDVVIIEIYHGAVMVGQYSVAYKWLSALNVIPAFFTQAMLPRMAQQAQTDPAALRRTYALALKLLVSLALPIAVVFTFAAYALVTLLGGADYLPDSAIATQLMIWSIPIGWMNSFTQYVLIALDRQRRITGAFAAAVTFNLVTNFIFVPQYGYAAAAITTILSEAVLFVPFVLLVQGAIGRVDWLAIVGKPLIAGALMFAVTVLLWPIAPLLALAVGGAVYGGAWWLLGTLTPDERAVLLPLLPARLRPRVLAQP